MIIICPRCTAPYDVDAAAFGPQPRDVQCSSCGYRWQQDAVSATDIAAVDADVRAALPPAAPPEVVAAAASAEIGSPPAAAPAFEPAPAPGTTAPPVASPAVATTNGGDAAPAAARDAATEAEAGDSDGTAARDAADTSPADRLRAVLDQDAQIATDAAAAGEPVTIAAPVGRPARPRPDIPANIDEILKAGVVSEGSLMAQLRGQWMFPAATIGILLLLLGALALARGPIVAAFPAAAGAYQAFGLAETTAAGELELREVTSLREWEGDQEVLIVRGLVLNVAARPVVPPPIRVALIDGSETELQVVTIGHESGPLVPGGAVPFEARVVNPALAAQRIRVTFAAAPVNS